MMPFPGAVFSLDRTHRFALTRQVEQPLGKFTILFIGINPSTADERTDDPTIRRLRAFACGYGARRFSVVNVFSQVTPDTRLLDLEANNLVRGSNHHTWRKYEQAADWIIPCWGSLAKLPVSLRPYVVAHGQRLRDLYGLQLRIFGLTRDGQPCHPLYRPRSARLTEWL